jgi:NTP pyrophosphatase (non-canonical NTP hydrolase)
MDLSKLQKEVSEFYEKYDITVSGKPESKDVSFIHLVEEVGELARQYINKETRPEQYKEAEVEDAFADIMINTLYLSSLFNVNVDQAIRKVLERDRKHLKSIKKD